jgi:hypothetical protein
LPWLDTVNRIWSRNWQRNPVSTFIVRAYFSAGKFLPPGNALYLLGVGAKKALQIRRLLLQQQGVAETIILRVQATFSSNWALLTSRQLRSAVTSFSGRDSYQGMASVLQRLKAGCKGTPRPERLEGVP